MNKSVIVRVSVAMLTSLIFLPSNILAITQMRISQINQFVSDLNRTNKYPTIAAITAKEADLKAGLSASELRNNPSVKSMNAAVKAATQKLQQQQPQIPSQPQVPGGGKQPSQIPPIGQQPTTTEPQIGKKPSGDEPVKQPSQEVFEQGAKEGPTRRERQLIKELEILQKQVTAFRASTGKTDSSKLSLSNLVSVSSSAQKLQDQFEVASQRIADEMKALGIVKSHNSILSQIDADLATMRKNTIIPLQTTLKKKIAETKAGIQARKENVARLVSSSQNIQASQIAAQQSSYKDLLTDLNTLKDNAKELGILEGAIATDIAQLSKDLATIQGNLARAEQVAQQAAQQAAQKAQETQIKQLAKTQMQETFKQIASFVAIAQKVNERQKAQGLLRDYENYKKSLTDQKVTLENLGIFNDVEFTFKNSMSLLERAKEALDEVMKPTLSEILVPKMLAIEERMKPFLSELNQVITVGKKPSQREIDALYKDLGEVQGMYVQQKDTNRVIAELISKLYRKLGVLDVWVRADFARPMTSQELVELVKQELDQGLWTALALGDITEDQYKKAVNARIGLIVALKEPEGSACVNLKAIDPNKHLTIGGKSYLNATDKANIKTLEAMCAKVSVTAQQDKEKEEAFATMKAEESYKLYIAPIEAQLADNQPLIKVLYDETSAFLQDLKDAQASLETPNIKVLNFKERYANIRRAIESNTKERSTERAALQTAVLDSIAQQIKRFIAASIRAHRKLTDLENLHTAIRGDVGSSVKALELIWRFEVGESGAKIPMIQQIQTMNNALKDLGLAFTNNMVNTNDSLAVEIANELFVSFGYLLASFDSLTHKILTTRENFLGWTGSWIAYMLWALFAGEGAARNPYSKQAYAKAFGNIRDAVFERIINGINIFDRALLRPILQQDLQYAKFNQGTWHIKNTIPSLQQEGQYIYQAVIDSVAVPGSNKAIPVSPSLVLDGQHNKSKMRGYTSYQGLTIEVSRLVNLSLGQMEAAQKNAAEAAFKGLVESIDTVRQAAVTQGKPLSAHEQDIKDSIATHELQWNP